MKWKTFWQVTILILITGIVCYIICPKYYFFHHPNDSNKNVTNYYRCNTITGKIQRTFDGGDWYNY